MKKELKETGELVDVSNVHDLYMFSGSPGLCQAHYKRAQAPAQALSLSLNYKLKHNYKIFKRA